MEQLVEAGDRPFNILSLDGGGSKGVYSLGVLREVETIISSSIHEKFDLIYGTSTGAIIAALLALGRSVDSISELYFRIIPDVMGRNSRASRTRALERHAAEVFGEARFDAFLTNIGIVATHRDYKRPMIFKSSVQQAHGRRGTFQPGFGCTVAEAVVASCAAYPFFETPTISTKNQGNPQLLDGGFVANNPALFAVADATRAFGLSHEQLRVLSIGVGSYPDERPRWLVRLLRKLWPLGLLETTLSSNTNTLDQLRTLLFPEIRTVRVDDSFTDGQYSTSLLESNVEKLRKIRDLGRESFARNESGIRALLNS